MSNSQLDDSQCPLCGQANLCAVSQGETGEQCWCQNQAIEPSLLAKIPDTLKGKSCICQRCIEQTHQLAREL